MSRPGETRSLAGEPRLGTVVAPEPAEENYQTVGEERYQSWFPIERVGGVRD